MLWYIAIIFRNRESECKLRDPKDVFSVQETKSADLGEGKTHEGSSQLVEHPVVGRIESLQMLLQTASLKREITTETSVHGPNKESVTQNTDHHPHCCTHHGERGRTRVRTRAVKRKEE
jgi:hypothetical protein